MAYESHRPNASNVKREVRHLKKTLILRHLYGNNKEAMREGFETFQACCLYGYDYLDFCRLGDVFFIVPRTDSGTYTFSLGIHGKKNTLECEESGLLISFFSICCLIEQGIGSEEYLIEQLIKIEGVITIFNDELKNFIMTYINNNRYICHLGERQGTQL